MNHPEDTPHDIAQGTAYTFIPAQHFDAAEDAAGHEGPPPDDVLDDAGLDLLLDAAGDSLLKHLEDTTDPCDLLLALLEADPGSGQ